MFPPRRVIKISTLPDIPDIILTKIHPRTALDSQTDDNYCTYYSTIFQVAFYLVICEFWKQEIGGEAWTAMIPFVHDIGYKSCAPSLGEERQSSGNVASEAPDIAGVNGMLWALNPPGKGANSSQDMWSCHPTPQLQRKGGIRHSAKGPVDRRAIKAFITHPHKIRKLNKGRTEKSHTPWLVDFIVQLQAHLSILRQWRSDTTQSCGK